MSVDRRCGVRAYLRRTLSRLRPVLGLVALFSGLATPCFAAGLPVRSGVEVSDLAKLCRPAAVQAVASRLHIKVTVKQLPRVEDANTPGGAHFVAAARGLPAYCQVTGSFVTDPKSGRTANFQATFPAAWNQKYLQLGCSGHCGQFAVSDPAAPYVTITTQGKPGEIIRQGFATFATDEGHVGFAGGTWDIKGPGRIDEAALKDFLYRADEVLARMGKELTVAFYAHATGQVRHIRYSYFCGCSGGGRDALVAASYFPQDFDGIIAGSAYANLVQVAFQAAGTSLATLRSPGAYVPPKLFAQIEPIVMAKCDALDGVKDGLIQNPGACNFTPQRDLPRCPHDKPASHCFTRAQIDTVSTLITAVTDRRGQVIQPGYSVSELQALDLAKPQHPNAPNPWVDNGNPYAGLGGLGDAVLRVFAHHDDPSFHTRSLISFGSGGAGPVTDYRIIVPGAEAARDEALLRRGIGNDPAKFAKLIGLQHKLLIWSNLSDQLLTPYMSIDLYKRLARLYGGYTKLQRNVRLFMIPGTSHCSMGGIGPGHFDALRAIENWVEKGRAPDGLIASLYNPNSPVVPAGQKPLRTMPLCKFPEMAHYLGHGNVRDAANWVCPATDRSMLKIGASGRQAGEID